MTKRTRIWIVVIVVALTTAAAGWLAWRARESHSPPWVALDAHPQRIMGTTCQLVAIAADESIARAGLGDAEAALRHVEALTSTWMESTPVSRLNQAPAGQEMSLPPEVVTILRTARRFHAASDGTFDVTVVPLIGLWRRAAAELRFPSAEEIAEARTASSWEDFHISDAGALKAQASAQVDLGGIACGFGIDQAVAAMKAAGVRAGRVEVGHDLRVFGSHPKTGVWEIPVPSPVRQGATLLTLRLNEGAVCTSGEFRFEESDEPHVGDVIDPATGKPAVMAHSATAVADDAMTADAWATALYVRGPVGLGLLPEGVDGLTVAGEKDDPRVWATPAAGNATIEASVRDSLQVIGRTKAR